MSIFVHSYDFTTGNSSDGTWEFGRTLRGNYRVDAQSMDTQTFPWMWTGQDTIVLRIPNPADINQKVEFPVTFPPDIGFMTNQTEILNAMIAVIQAEIDVQTVIEPYVARTVSGSVDEGNKNLVFVFDVDPVDIMWASTNYDSTLNPSVDKVGAENELNITNWNLSYAEMVTDPRYLEVYIAESVTEYMTTHGTYPTLLFSTRDNEFTGQTFEIRNDTTELNISVHKMGGSNSIPLTGQWYLVLTPF